MRIRRLFLPSFFCAMVFVRPVFAAIGDAVDVNAANAAYRAEIEALMGDYEGKDIKQGVKNAARSEVESNVAGSGAPASASSAAAAETAPPEPTATPEEIAELEKKAADAKATEQSTENKMLGGLTMAATGIGGMQLMQGMAEQKADDEAAKDMEAYLATIKCGVGGIIDLKYNDIGSTPAENRELGDARMKYAELADKIKRAKNNLGMPPGIESELIIDTSALYARMGDQDGIVHHFDTATERSAEGEGKKRAIAGGVALGAGALGGIIGNQVINGEGAKEKEENEKKAKEYKDMADQKRKDAAAEPDAAKKKALYEEADKLDKEAAAYEEKNKGFLSGLFGGGNKDSGNGSSGAGEGITKVAAGVLGGDGGGASALGAIGSMLGGRK